MGLDEKLVDGSHGMAKRAVTSDDLAVRTYSIVVGKAFK
jgi:hypothetical protein